ncbi:MAG: hypothetical protein R2942_13430 [Ignavibacteria bacterium]
MIILFFVFLILLTSFKITGDDDVFWHLATGRYIVETQHVPSTDIFGFVTEGQEWMPFEWGWDVITYGLFNIGGYNAILVFQDNNICSDILTVLSNTPEIQSKSYTDIFFLTLLAFGIIDRLTPRPHIMSLLFCYFCFT